MKQFLITGFFIVMTCLWGADILVQLDDATGDDYGAGKVVYPEHPMFTPGLFDIDQFRIEDAGDNYLFVVRVKGKVQPVDFSEFEYRYNIPDDFIFPLVQIYIDTDHTMDAGITQTLAGVNAVIAPESAWERAVVFTSLPQRFKIQTEHFHSPYVSRIFFSPKIHISRDGHEMKVSVPKKFLGTLHPDWGYTVLMLGHEPGMTVKKSIYVMEVKSTASLLGFGGGDAGLVSRYNTNIIDMIAPLNFSQESTLRNYSAENKTLAVIHGVYPHPSALKGRSVAGVVKQIADEKVVINLGSEQGLQVGDLLLVDNAVVVVVDQLFPQLCMAHCRTAADASKLTQGLKVVPWHE
ncbi:MAG: hypothetical protein J7K89_01900 [Candidatus Cloacimonetes bacterium]|nr:hypothetical protein [Candidatus Cloacimonadota bacterium]